MKKITFLCVISIMIFFTACDCCQVVSGIVIDEKSGLPLRDVNVYKKSQVNNNETTDSNGYFEIFSISGGLFGCPPMEVVFECENYETKEVKIPAGGNKTVKLKKKN